MAQFCSCFDLRMLNKAALIMEDDLTPEGNRANEWRLASVQQVEEVKCLARIFPIWAAGILCHTSMIQQFTFTISQALQMDRHLRPSFQIPAGSITVVSFLTIALCVPIYDRLLVPALRNVTRLETGITVLQRIGIGMLFSVLAMVVAGSIERARRASVLSHPDPDRLGVAPMWVMWLVPQLLLMGLCEAFDIIGQIEFFNRECPEHMRSIANSLLSCSFGVASYVNSLMITTVRYASRTKTKPGWLGNDLNVARLDYFYYLLAGIGVLNFGYFLFVARRYLYKEGLQGRYGDGDGDASRDVELGPRKVTV